MIRALLLSLALVSAAPALANWQGFYTPSERVARGMAVAPDAVCVREILRAQLRHSIPDNILLGIGLQEAGIRRNGRLTVWPWAVNAEGEGRLFDSRDSALDWVAGAQAEGISSIDVGCMQVNLHWHPEAFGSVAEGFDPARNVDYAARFLKRLHAKTGDWELAAGSYHSFTPERRETYLDSLRRNVKAANARLDEFRAIAAEAQPRGDAPAATGAAPRASVFWSAGLSRAREADEGRRSLYSDQALQPVLPAFRREP